MAVHQYIGARYVPKFYENSNNTAEWQSGVIYEPLTIVTYNGNSYTSKKYVPSNIGNPSVNTDYWVATGLYNEQINNLSNQVNALADRTENVENRTGFKIIFIGDSYGTGEGADSAVTSYIARCANALGLVENSTYWNNSIGGASFHGWNGRRTYRSLLEEVAPGDDDEITHVVVCGGINDATSGATLSANITAMEDFVTYAKTRFENAKIIIGFLGWTTGVTTNINIVNTSLPAYKYAGEKGAAFVNLNCLNHDYHNFQSDGSHPTADGAKCIGWGLASYLKGGSPIDGALRYRTLNITLNSEKFASGSPNIQEYIDENCVYVSVGKATLTLQNDITISSDVEIEIGTINYNNYMNSIVELGSPTVKIAIFGQPSTIYTYGVLRFDANGKKLYLRPIFNGTFTSNNAIVIFGGICGAIPLEWC